MAGLFYEILCFYQMAGFSLYSDSTLCYICLFLQNVLERKKMCLREKKSRSGQTVLGHPLFRDEFFGIKKG